jgi:hypothetical protein
MISFGLILNLVKTGQTCDFHTFMERAMVFREIQTEIQRQKKVVVNAMEALFLKRESLGKSLTTPLSVCKEYIELEDGIKTVTNKRRKEYQRQIDDILQTNRNCVRDAAQVRHFNVSENEFVKERDHLNHLEEYLSKKTETIVEILCKRGFLQREDLPKEVYSLTTGLGQMAAQLAEVPGTIFAELLVQWDYLRGATVAQIVGILSCISDIKVSEEVRVSTPYQVSDAFVKRRIEEMRKLYGEYATIESDYDISTGTKYEGGLLFDLVDELMEWTTLQTEGECRELVYRIAEEKGVSLGEFTKGILKINAVAKELSMVLPLSETECLKKFTEVEASILKFVATTQSLYI